MSFSKSDLELIKSKINLSNEIEKRTKVIKKGKDYWACCPFHEEKTPSCKINNDIGTYYCFGCGAKGDIFSIYTDLYNYSFPDAVKELASTVGIKISNTNFEKDKKNEKIINILEASTKWFQDNLNLNENCIRYLKSRKLNKDTVNLFKLGYSYNPKTNLYNHLKNNGFKDEDILESNVVKTDSNNKIRDFFYKRLIFPILSEQGKIVGFGGRVLDNSNPKYINSPESTFFKKRSILYNLNNAKKTARIKNNMLICEGYMDVITLYQNNIKTAVAPLGTSFTEDQLLLSWKFVQKPTLMFDSDASGLKAAYRASIMSLPLLSPDKYIQFVELPKNLDPDTYINNYSFSSFVKLIKKPISLVNFLFKHSSQSIDFSNPDNKISFDKFIDDLTNKIKDSKIRYFYKNEFKSLFFNSLKQKRNPKKDNLTKPSFDSLIKKQILSFLVTTINHKKIRKNLIKILLNTDLLNEEESNFLNFLDLRENVDKNPDQLLDNDDNKDFLKIIDKSREKALFELFPYCSGDYDPETALLEVKKSLENLNTRLSNLKKINKSLDKFDEKFSSLKWEELREIGNNYHNMKDKE